MACRGRHYLQYRVEQASILVTCVELAADCESRALNRQLRYLASRRAEFHCGLSVQESGADVAFAWWFRVSHAGLSVAQAMLWVSVAGFPGEQGEQPSHAF